MAIVGNLKVGKPDTTPDKPAHVQGVREGNQPGGFERTPGLYKSSIQGNFARGDETGKGTARRSTGVNPGPKNPITSNSPNLSPA